MRGNVRLVGGLLLLAFAVALLLRPVPAGAAEPTGLHEVFSQLADGPAPSTTTDGLEVVNHAYFAGAEPYVRGGRLTSADPAIAQGGSYRIAELDSDVTTIGATWAFTPWERNGGLLCLSIQDESIAGRPSGEVPVSPVHLIVAPTWWGVDVNAEAGTGVETVKIGGFDSPLASDGVTLHRVEATLDRTNERLRLELPDGSTRTISSPAFAMAGSFAYVEPYRTPGRTAPEQTSALVESWWADTGEVEVAAPTPVTQTKSPDPSPAPSPTTSPVVTAPVPAPVIQAASPMRPKMIRAVRSGTLTRVSWQSAGADRYVVRCGRHERTTSALRAVFRSASSRSCKVRSVTSGSTSPWAKVRVKVKRPASS